MSRAPTRHFYVADPRLAAAAALVCQLGYALATPCVRPSTDYLTSGLLAIRRRGVTAVTDRVVTELAVREPSRPVTVLAMIAAGSGYLSRLSGVSGSTLDIDVVISQLAALIDGRLTYSPPPIIPVGTERWIAERGLTPELIATFTRSGLVRLMVATHNQIRFASDHRLDTIGRYLAAHQLGYATTNNAVPLALLLQLDDFDLRVSGQQPDERVWLLECWPADTTLGYFARLSFDELYGAIYLHVRGTHAFMATQHMQTLLRKFGISLRTA